MARRRRGSRRNQNTDMTKVILGVIVAGFGLYVLSNSGIFGGGGGDAELCLTGELDTEKSGYCTLRSNAYDSVVIVTGNTQNSPEPTLDFNSGELKAALSDIFYGRARSDSLNVSIISAAGGNDNIAIEGDYAVPQNMIASNNKLNKVANEINQRIKQPADSAGADYFGAIKEAEKIMRGSERPLLIVVGSGYSDSGLLNFAVDDLFDKYNRDENSIVNILKQDKDLEDVDLSKAKVVWYDLSETVAPQRNMDAVSNTTEKIYKSALKYIGAKDVEFRYSSNTTASTKSVDSKYTVQQTYVDELKVGDTFDVNENIGEFKPDEAVLKNPASVSDKLASFASRFNVNTKIRLRLTGYVAICDSSNGLSVERAKVIKNILVKLGVPSNRIDVRGFPGSPSEKADEEYTCDSDLPETERRTVRIEVVKD